MSSSRRWDAMRRAPRRRRSPASTPTPSSSSATPIRATIASRCRFPATSRRSARCRSMSRPTPLSGDAAADGAIVMRGDSRRASLYGHRWPGVAAGVRIHGDERSGTVARRRRACAGRPGFAPRAQQRAGRFGRPSGAAPELASAITTSRTSRHGGRRARRSTGWRSDDRSAAPIDVAVSNADLRARRRAGSRDRRRSRRASTAVALRRQTAAPAGASKHDPTSLAQSMLAPNVGADRAAVPLRPRRRRTARRPIRGARRGHAGGRRRIRSAHVHELAPSSRCASRFSCARRRRGAPERWQRSVYSTPSIEQRTMYLRRPDAGRRTTPATSARRRIRSLLFVVDTTNTQAGSVGTDVDQEALRSESRRDVHVTVSLKPESSFDVTF